MVAVSGAIAEPTVISVACPTGTAATAGVTTMGGGVGVPALDAGLGAALGAGGAAGEGDGEGGGV